ncbi:unnamed protein product [Zymoseptoria tritici ST99CH_1E4]|uniref:Uncharacterized protein n=1 Tax=Zymoseptoria tritici ST99CH_1E4 TaxID=1276532 RepID=A0A2H1GQ37_ZYMTR|nr:unnamed protein product [Zymoseptoria tritici ST99CH_1E4]
MRTMASTNPSATRKPANRMTAEIADYNEVPRSTQEHGTFKWTNRSWYAIEDKTPCDYLVKYETRGVARGMIRFARLEAQTNAPISVGELAVRVAALQEAHDATTVSGLVQAKMRAKVWYPWRKELAARGYGKGVSQLFFAKMDDEDGEETGVGKAPEEDDDVEEDEDDEEMGEEMDLDEKQLGEEFEDNDANASNKANDEEQMHTAADDGHELSVEKSLATEQLHDGEGRIEIEENAADEEVDEMAIDDTVQVGEEMYTNEAQLDEASEINGGDLSVEASGPEEMQLQDNEGLREEMDVDEELMVEAPENSTQDASIETGDMNQMATKDSHEIDTDEDMDVDLEQIFDEEGRPILDANPDLENLRLLFPNGNW